MAPRIRVDKNGEPLMPVTSWVPVSWSRPIRRMAEAERIKNGNQGVVEVALREALERRGLLGASGGEDSPKSPPKASADDAARLDPAA